MTDHANELRRHASKIPYPQGETPGVMLRAADEIERLRAKIEAMERQEPAGYGVRYVEPTNGAEDWDSIWMHRVFAEDHIKDFTQAYVDIGEPVGAIAVVPLYALPGAQAQPAPSVQDVPAKSLKPVIDWLRNGCDPMRAADELDLLIAAAQEAKP